MGGELAVSGPTAVYSLSCARAGGSIGGRIVAALVTAQLSPSLPTAHTLLHDIVNCQGLEGWVVQRRAEDITQLSP